MPKHGDQAIRARPGTANPDMPLELVLVKPDVVAVQVGVVPVHLEFPARGMEVGVLVLHTLLSRGSHVSLEVDPDSVVRLGSVVDLHCAGSTESYVVGFLLLLDVDGS